MSFKDKILNNESPWGSPPGGGGRSAPGGNGSGSRQDPPNFDDIIRNQPFKKFQKLPMPNEQTKKSKEHLKKQFLEHNDSIIEMCFIVYNKFIN